MMKLFTAGALVALSILTAGCNTGCSTLGKVTDPAPVFAGQKIDEQTMGAVDALGTSTNYLITAAAHSGKLTREQVAQLVKVRADLDAAHDAAKKAYDAGDAAGFSQKVKAIKDLALSVQNLYSKVTQ